MGTAIHSIPMGVGNIYILRDRGTIVIDGGAPKKDKVFLKNLEKAGIKPEEIKLIILTHGHWDHIGSAADIKEITGAKILMHEEERKWLETPIKKMPPGVTTWGKILTSLLAGLMLPFIHIKTAKVDLAVTDAGFSLGDYGIPGRIVYTPGHTAGSISILLDSGEAFVGDLAMNAFPLRTSPGLPVFAEDMPAVLVSWKRLLDQGVTTIYPGHGRPFAAEIIKKAIGY